MLYKILQVKTIFFSQLYKFIIKKMLINPMVVVSGLTALMAISRIYIQNYTYKLYMYIFITFKCLKMIFRRCLIVSYICIYVQIKFLTSHFFCITQFLPSIMKIIHNSFTETKSYCAKLFATYQSLHGTSFFISR